MSGLHNRRGMRSLNGCGRVRSLSLDWHRRTGGHHHIWHQDGWVHGHHINGHKAIYGDKGGSSGRGLLVSNASVPLEGFRINIPFLSIKCMRPNKRCEISCGCWGSDPAYAGLSGLELAAPASFVGPVELAALAAPV